MLRSASWYDRSSSCVFRDCVELALFSDKSAPFPLTEKNSRAPLQKISYLPNGRNKNKGKQLNVLGRKTHNACRPLSDKRWTPCMHTAGIQEQQHVPCSLKPAYSSCLSLLVKGVRTNHCRGINCVFNSALTTASCEGQGIHWVRLLWKSSRAVLSWHTTFMALFGAETELGIQRGWGVGR